MQDLSQENSEAAKDFEFPIFLRRRLHWRAHIIQALMADIGSTLVDTPQQGKEKKLNTREKREYKKEKNCSKLRKMQKIFLLFAVNLELIHSLWVPNIFIYNLKTFQVK